MHKTQWLEIAHLFWKCEGCARQCQVFRTLPKDNLECDASDKRISEVVTHKEVKDENG